MRYKAPADTTGIHLTAGFEKVSSTGFITVKASDLTEGDRLGLKVNGFEPVEDEPVPTLPAEDKKKA